MAQVKIVGCAALHVRDVCLFFPLLDIVAFSVYLDL